MNFDAYLDAQTERHFADTDGMQCEAIVVERAGEDVEVHCNDSGTTDRLGNHVELTPEEARYDGRECPCQERHPPEYEPGE